MMEKLKFKKKVDVKLINEQNCFIFTAKEWNANKDFKYQNCYEIIKNVEQAYIRNIITFQINRPKIIKEIQFISFPYLQTLILQKNNINNIQALIYLKTSNLNTIDLNDNQIWNINSLIKMISFKIGNIHFEGNFISQTKLQRLKMPKKCFQISLQWFAKGNVTQQDRSKFMKLQFKYINKKRLFNLDRSKSRIQQNKVHNQIYQNFKTTDQYQF